MVMLRHSTHAVAAREADLLLGSGVAAGFGEVFLQVAAVARLRNVKGDGVAEAAGADLPHGHGAQVGGVGVTPVRGRMRETDVCEVIYRVDILNSKS